MGLALPNLTGKGNKRVVLKPANAAFAPIVINAVEAQAVRVVAEVAQVLRG